MAELWDAYDKDFNRIEGITLVRGESIPNGMYHLIADIVVKHTDKTYLLMQRDYNKHWGGLWELTAGGSALLGESPLDCAIRELREETGIESENFEYYGTVVSEEYHTIYAEFLCTTNCNKDTILLQEGETIAYKWLTEDELENFPEKELSSRRGLIIIQKE